MKKIFAIALALVMVLSMASAFASYCTAGFDWTCATTEYNCGKATVEVIPYVKTNAACNGSEFVESDCAAAIKGENVYYAIKLTVAEDVDLEWWKQVKFELSVKGMTKDWSKTKISAPTLKADDSEDGWVFYYVYNTAKKTGGWSGEVTENENFELDTVINKSVVKEFAKAKVCMTLTSVKDAKKGEFAGTVGEYYVVYAEGVDAVAEEMPVVELVFASTKAIENNKFKVASGWTIVSNTFDPNADTVTLVLEGSKVSATEAQAKKAAWTEKTDTSGAVVKTYAVEYAFVPGVEEVVAEANALYVYSKNPADGGKLLVTYTMVDGKVSKIEYTNHCGEAAYATIKAFFGLEIGTCVDKDLITANFGWKDEVKSCYEWKTENAVAIVDTECVVAIPKTGDASVLAWLF